MIEYLGRPETAQMSGAEIAALMLADGVVAKIDRQYVNRIRNSLTNG